MCHNLFNHPLLMEIAIVSKYFAISNNVAEDNLAHIVSKACDFNRMEFNS